MSVSETEEWRAERDLALWKEAIDVQVLFRYQVCCIGASTYLCQEFHVEDEGDRTRITLFDVWCYDALMSKRMVSRVTMVVREYEILELKREGEL